MSKQTDGVWIPAELFEDENLTEKEILYYAKIKMLQGDTGCYATNNYFAELFGRSKKTVSIIINSLIKKGYLKPSYTYKSNTKAIDKRILTDTYGRKCNEGIIKGIPETRDRVSPKPSRINKEYNKDSSISNNPESENSDIFIFVEKYYNHQKSLNDIKPLPLYKSNKKKAIADAVVTIKRLIETDGYTLFEIKKALGWAIKDSFWKTKVLSLSQLRKKTGDTTKFYNLYNASLNKSKKELEQDNLKREEQKLKDTLLNEKLKDQKLDAQLKEEGDFDRMELLRKNNPKFQRFQKLKKKVA